MKARLLLVLPILTLAAGCAPGYYETPQAGYQQEATRQWHANPYTNPETEQEYRRRIWWENYETERPRFFHRWP